MQEILLSGPSPNARSGHIEAWSWFQLREQSSSCWELAAAQVSAVFLAPCLLQALTRGMWPRKQLSPHLKEEMQPPQPPPPPALGPNNQQIPAWVAGVKWTADSLRGVPGPFCSGHSPAETWSNRARMTSRMLWQWPTGGLKLAKDSEMVEVTGRVLIRSPTLL